MDSIYIQKIPTIVPSFSAPSYFSYVDPKIIMI